MALGRSDTYKEWKLTVQGEWRNGNIHGYITNSYSDGHTILYENDENGKCIRYIWDKGGEHEEG